MAYNRSELVDINSQLSINKDMKLVIAGHVDHGKSTILGRLLAETNSLPEGKLEQVKEKCRRNSRPFEYAFLLDALKDEQAQGITIDSARVFFKTDYRRYIILDAPGHIEFLKNMVTGANRAEAALLVIDAAEGIQENSRRHGYMLSMLGIKQIAVLVNKMDLVDYKQKVYNKIVKEYREFLTRVEIEPIIFIPVSGIEGDNIASLSKQIDWYNGQTVLELIDSFENTKLPIDKPFRMPVQDIYKFTRGGDARRIVAGTISTGELNIGDEVVFYPSGKRSIVRTIEGFNETPQDNVKAGKATGFTLNEQIYITRGEIVTRADEEGPKTSSRVKANIFWLGKKPMIMDKVYYLKLGTARVKLRLEKINRVINASNLSQTYKEEIDRHDVAECILKMDKAISFDLTGENEELSRFVIVDEYEISGGGIIQDALTDERKWLRDKIFRRNYKWEQSLIDMDERAEKYNQKPTLLLITGEEDVGKKPIAKALERRLFEDGKIVYFLGIGNFLYGVDADIKNEENGNHKEEHLRRLAEVGHIMLDAGAILVVTAVKLTQSDLELIKSTVIPQQIETVWIGDKVTTDIKYDLQITDVTSYGEAVIKIKGFLQDRGIIFRPW